MAPMPERRKQDRELRKLISDGVFATEDKQGQVNILRQWQREGLVPPQFETPNQLIDNVAEVIASGKTKVEALKELEVFLPKTFFSKEGKINKRVVRNVPGKSLSDAWDLVNKGLSAEQLGKLQRSDWGDLQAQYREVGRRLGMNLDIGHFKTSAAGAPQDVSAGSAEYNKANQAAGRTENAYRPISSQEMEDVGASSNKVEGLSEAAVRAYGLPTRGGSIGSPLNPYIGALLGTEYKGKSSRLLPAKGLEQLNRAFEDQVRQGANPVAMYDYLRERAGEKVNLKEMAQAGLEDYDLSRFNPSAAADVPIKTQQVPKGSTITLNSSFKAATGLTSPTVKPTTPARPTSKVPPAQATKPAAKPKPTAPKPTSKPRSRLPVSARPTTTPSSSKPTAMNPGSASQQIRRLQNSAGDVLRIIPGEWRPSNLPGV